MTGKLEKLLWKTVRVIKILASTPGDPPYGISMSGTLMRDGNDYCIIPLETGEYVRIAGKHVDKISGTRIFLK